MTRSVANLSELDALDQAEMVDGYWDGFAGEPEPGDNRSLSFWHGWRNGATDKSLRPIDSEQTKLAHLWLKRERASKPKRTKPRKAAV